MKSNLLFGALVASLLSLVMFPAQAQNVRITSLGSNDGELCWYDRAMLLEDPSGVNILIQPGRTVNAGDPRLEGVNVNVIVLDHAHGDHMGDRENAGCGGGSPGTLIAPFPSIVRIAAEKHSVVLAGGELAGWLNERLNAFGESRLRIAAPNVIRRRSLEVIELQPVQA